MIELPLVVEGRSVGLIEVADYRSSRRMVGSATSPSVRRSPARPRWPCETPSCTRSCSEQADRDSLTDLLNHRAFYDRLARSWRARTGTARRWA